MMRYPSLAKENQLLRERLQYYTAQEVAMKEQEAENQRLRGYLGLVSQAKGRFVAAHIIGREPNNWRCAVFIDKGRQDDITGDLPVSTPLGLVGKTAEVASRMSKVLLISDPNMSVACLIQRNRQEGILRGSFQGPCKMDFFSKDPDVKIGDVIITAGLGKIYPKGILVGRVVGIDQNPEGIGYSALVEPAVELSSLEEVLVEFP